MSRSSLLKNTSYLFAIQIANQILPLLVVPYLTRTLGVETYGVFAYAMAIVMIGNVITDFGFNLWATAEIAKEDHNYDRVNYLIGSVLGAKAILFGLVAASILIYGYSTTAYQEHRAAIQLLTLPLAGLSFLPMWFFNGIEQMGRVTVFLFVSRVLYLVLVYLTVNSSADLLWLVIVNGLSQISATSFAFYSMRRLGYWPIKPTMQSSLHALRVAGPFFVSRAAVSTYTAGGTLFLGWFSTSANVGYYALADQLYRGLQALISPVGQAIYPHMIKTKNFQLLFRVAAALFLLSIVGALLGLALSDWIIASVFGKDYLGASSAFCVLLFALAFNTPSVLIGYPLFGALNLLQFANYSVIFAGALQFVILTVFWVFHFTSAVQVAASVLLAELLVLLLRVSWGVSKTFIKPVPPL